jgi:hypothetical protein
VLLVTEEEMYKRDVAKLKKTLALQKGAPLHEVLITHAKLDRLKREGTKYGLSERRRGLRKL